MRLASVFPGSEGAWRRRAFSELDALVELPNSYYGPGVPYTMRFADIDPILTGWSRENQIPLYTEYKDSEVRAFEIVGLSGQRSQICI